MNKGTMAILDQTGDTKIIWDRNNPDEVTNAKRSFDEMRGKGYVAYSVEGKDGTKGKVLEAFDPSAERIILAPPLKPG